MRCLLALLALPAIAAFAQDDVLLRAMQDELQRSRALRAVNPEQPYYIEYALDDFQSVSGSATLGALVASHSGRFRLPRVQVRVGDYQYDNTNYIGSDYYSGTRWEVSPFPLEYSYAVLRHQFWLATDTAYKAAVEAYSRKRAALKNMTLTEQWPDFSKAAPLQRLETVHPTIPDLAEWTARARRLSALFQDYPAVLASVVDFAGGAGASYLLTSEGARVRIPQAVMLLRVRASAQAPDGMVVRDAAVFQALDARRMPPEAEMERGIRQVAQELVALAQAPVGDAYTGPVLFDGIAGPQLLAEVLGKNLALPRRPVTPPGRDSSFPSSELEGRLGVRILPEWMSVVDDPTQKEWQGRPLFGYYTVDLEGLAPRPLTLVDQGVLKSFLLTRQPVKGFEASNGRARLPGSFGAKTAGFGNLFVSVSESLPAAELRQKLIALCRERGKPYGIVVRKMDFPSSASVGELRRILAGMTRSGGSARPVSLPLLAYRVYADGREELLRGLRFRGLTARSLKDIVAASRELQVFDFQDNNAPFAMMGGAGYVAETSVIAPSILVDDLELEKEQEELPKPPVVPPPPLTDAPPPPPKH
jgi:predicted Zn-dependent protease